jgi:hypothetical protein
MMGPKRKVHREVILLSDIAGYGMESSTSTQIFVHLSGRMKICNSGTLGEELFAQIVILVEDDGICVFQTRHFGSSF